jgi:hypothetical protein
LELIDMASSSSSSVAFPPVCAKKFTHRFLRSGLSGRLRLSLSSDGASLEWRDFPLSVERDDNDAAAICAPLGSIALRDVRRVGRDRERNDADTVGLLFHVAVALADGSVHSFAVDTERQMIHLIRALSAVCGLQCDEVEPVPASPTDPLAIVHAGWLHKRGAVNTAFKRRWFVLRRNNELFWSVGAKALPLRSIKLGAHDTEDFAVRHEFALWTKARKFVLRADTAEEQAAWLAVLRSCRHGAPVEDNAATLVADDAALAPEAAVVVVGAAEPLFALERWASFDVLGEFSSAPLAAAASPVHPLPSECVVCTNQALAALDAEQERRLASGLTKAFDGARNRFAELPRALARSCLLVRLDLGHNCLAALDAAVLGALPALEVLDLSNNQLVELPDCIGQLTALRQLFLHNDRAELMHGGNALRALPSSLGNCSALEVLDVTANGTLRDLPWQMVQCRRMRQLRLSSNSFRHVPACVGNMLCLTELLIKHNQLTCLDAVVFFGLTALETLHVSFNAITEIPLPLSSLQRIDQLFLEGNPIRLQAAPVAKSLGKMLQALRSELSAPRPCVRLCAYVCGLGDAPGDVSAMLRRFATSTQVRDGGADCDLSLPPPANGELVAASGLSASDSGAVALRLRTVPLELKCDAFHSVGALVFFAVRLDEHGAALAGDVERVTSELERLCETRRQSWRLPLTPIPADAASASALLLKLLTSASSVRDAVSFVNSVMPTKTLPEQAKALRGDAAARLFLGGCGVDDDLLDGVLIVALPRNDAAHDSAADALRRAFPRLAALEAGAHKLARPRFVVAAKGDSAAHDALAGELSTLAWALALRAPTKVPLPFAVTRSHVELARHLDELRSYADGDAAHFVPMLTHAEFGRLAAACGVVGAPSVRAAWRLMESWGVVLPIAHSLQRHAPAVSAEADQGASVASRLASVASIVTRGVRAFGRSAFLVSSADGARPLLMWPTPRSIACVSARLIHLVAHNGASDDELDFAALQRLAQRNELTSLPQVQRLLQWQ